MHQNFVKNIENTINQVLADKRHGCRNVDFRQLSDTFCVGVVSLQNRFSKAYFGFNTVQNDIKN